MTSSLFFPATWSTTAAAWRRHFYRVLSRRTRVMWCRSLHGRLVDTSFISDEKLWTCHKNVQTECKNGTLRTTDKVHLLCHDDIRQYDRSAVSQVLTDPPTSLRWPSESAHGAPAAHHQTAMPRSRCPSQQKFDTPLLNHSTSGRNTNINNGTTRPTLFLLFDRQ
jgi:hypothetical protein